MQRADQTGEGPQSPMPPRATDGDASGRWQLTVPVRETSADAAAQQVRDALAACTPAPTIVRCEAVEASPFSHTRERAYVVTVDVAGHGHPQEHRGWRTMLEVALGAPASLRRPMA